MAQVVTTILLEDNPQGLRLIEVSNWSGKAFIVPRISINKFKERNESCEPGLYFLFGNPSENKVVYVGQSEVVINRLTKHDSDGSKGDWVSAVVFTGSLDTTYIKYLESISVDLARKVNRWKIINSAIPKRNKLSEAQQITVDQYFENIKLIIGLNGYPIFDEPKKAAIELAETYLYKTVKAKATGSLLPNGEFMIHEGSTAMVRETKSFKGSGPALRKRLVDEGVLKPQDASVYRFTKDYFFSSPTAAGYTVSGRATNGWTAWKNQNGVTLDEIVRGADSPRRKTQKRTARRVM